VVENNAHAQEKGVEATLAFVSHSGFAGDIAREVMTGLISKCLAAPKCMTRQLAAQVSSLLLSVEQSPEGHS
jgi:cytoskeleton-associated protein 5